MSAMFAAAGAASRHARDRATRILPSDGVVSKRREATPPSLKAADLEFAH